MKTDETKPDYTTKAKTIFRTIKNEDHPFVMIDRRPIENISLSWGAKGVLSYLLSRPDNWTVRLGDLVKRSTDGVYKIRGYIKELINAGHIHRVERRDPKTKRITEYTLEVYELPFTKPLTNLPQAGLPQAGNLVLNDIDLNENDVNDIGVPPNLPLEWQILAGQEVTELPDQDDARRKDAANLIATGMGGKSREAYAIAYEFMSARKIVIPHGNLKGQRKPVKAMLDSKVKPEHVRQAVEELTSKNMTITDLFSVSRTAIDLANPPEPKREPERKHGFPSFKDGRVVTE